MRNETRAASWTERWIGLAGRDRILHLTSGDGRLTAALLLDGRRVLACGDDVRALEPVVGHSRLTLECRDLETEEWPWEEETFGAAVLTTPVSLSLIEAAYRSLVPEGVLILDMPSAADLLLRGLDADPRYPEEGALLKHLPSGARLLAYEEGVTADDAVRVRLVAVKPGNPTPYAYPIL